LSETKTKNKLICWTKTCSINFYHRICFKVKNN